MTPFERTLRPEDVAELIDLTVKDDPETRSMADMQLEGIAALYNILCEAGSSVAKGWGRSMRTGPTVTMAQYPFLVAASFVR